jgi:predicted nucleic acid-binding protein
MRVYLDACVVIYRVEGAVPLRAAAQTALDALAADDIACISDLVRMECLIKPLRERDSSLLAAYEAQFAALETLPIVPAIFDLAAELRAGSGLRTPDALHAACAIHHACGELWTNDDRLRAVDARVRTRLVRGA